MSHVFKGQISHYSGLQEFQERAVKTLNELFGRHKALDVFDFTIDVENEQYIAVGYREGEDAPAEQKSGEPLSVAAQEAISQPAVDAPAEDAEQPKAPVKDKAKKKNGKSNK